MALKTIAITQARVGSSRLPGKVLMRLAGKSLLQIHLERILQSKEVDKLIVATTVEPDASLIGEIAASLGVEFYRGSTDDVLDRFYQAAKPESPDYVVRLTSDCPLIDPGLIDKVVAFTIDRKLDYGSNVLKPSFPDGQDVEVFTFKALENAWEKATLKSEREHVTPFIWKNSSFAGGKLFRSDNYAEGMSFGDLRMTVDEPKDFELVRHLIEELGTGKDWQEYATFLTDHPEVQNMNSSIQRNEGYDKSLRSDK